MSAKKTYIALFASPLSIDISTGGGSIATFDFRGGFRHPAIKPASYTTGDLKEQELLEKHPLFGSAFMLSNTAPVKSQNIPENTALTLKEFININEAKDFLKGEPYNIQGNKIPTLKSVINMGVKLGFEIKITNNENQE